MAFAIIIMVPLTALMPNPTHRSGNARAKGFMGTAAGQKPSTTKLSMAATPATMDIPRVWTMRIVGKAHMVGASFTHWLKAMFSRKTRKSCIYYSLCSWRAVLLSNAYPTIATKIVTMVTQRMVPTTRRMDFSSPNHTRLE